MNKFAIISLKIFFACAFCALFLLPTSCEEKKEVSSADSENEKQEETGEVQEEIEKELPPPTAKEIGYAYGAILARAAMMNHLEMDISAVYKGLKDNVGVKNIDIKKHEDVLRRAFEEGKKKYAAENLEKQTKFLEENKTKEGVVTLESGLQYKMLKKGDANSKQPAKDSKVKIVYEGIALGQEKNFDSSDGKEIELSLDNVIEGWREIVPIMHIGDEVEVYIPANLGYGENGINYQGQEIIPPNALLTFKIELKGIVEPEGDSKEESAQTPSTTEKEGQ